MRGTGRLVGHHAAVLPFGSVHFFITQSRKGAKKVLARPVILDTYLGDYADVYVIQIVISRNKFRMTVIWRGDSNFSSTPPTKVSFHKHTCYS